MVLMSWAAKNVSMNPVHTRTMNPVHTRRCTRRHPRRRAAQLAKQRAPSTKPSGCRLVAVVQKWLGAARLTAQPGTGRAAAT